MVSGMIPMPNQIISRTNFHERINNLKVEGVILDEATGVYWNWKKSKAKSEAEAKEKGYTKTKNAYKGYVGSGYRRQGIQRLQAG